MLESTGGGGITPDVLVKPAPLTRTTQLLEVRSAIFNYGVDYAAKHPDLNKDLVISSQQYGLLTGIFFPGYFTFEIPSNLLLHKVGDASGLPAY